MTGYSYVYILSYNQQRLYTYGYYTYVVYYTEFNPHCKEIIITIKIDKKNNNTT